jgi:hypothetical protein
MTTNVNYCKGCKYIRRKRGYLVHCCSRNANELGNKIIVWENSRACENFEPVERGGKR